jgi:hypothetical protein
MQEQPESKDLLSQAASLLGKQSYPARLKRYGKRGLKAKLSAAGKAAKRTGASGRPRLPDSKVKPATLYQRERRARLKAGTRVDKGKKG